jgi:hypothetical protein
MKKIYAACLAVTLLLSVGSFAAGYLGVKSIGQAENFDIYGKNMVSVIGGYGSTTSVNIGKVDQSQSSKGLFNIWASQSETSKLNQNADASGKCGNFNVVQTGSAEGAQNQASSNTWRNNSTSQGQSLEVNLGQSLEKNGGFGNAGGVQSSISEQSQSIGGAGSIMNESQFIGAMQKAEISGSPWSDTEVFGYISVITNQQQNSN